MNPCKPQASLNYLFPMSHIEEIEFITRLDGPNPHLKLWKCGNRTCDLVVGSQSHWQLGKRGGHNYNNNNNK